MLLRLALEQFVVVETGELEFGSGLNVLTGETGAGKSILIDALGLLTGGRGRAEWVRPGGRRLSIEGVFDLRDQPETLERLRVAEIPMDEDDWLIVRREIGTDGRSRSFVNGRQILVSQLRELTTGLVWIVGQGEQRALLSQSQQEQLLDRIAGSAEAARAYRDIRRNFLTAKNRIGDLERARQEFRAEEEWLEYQVQEIDALGLRPGEREELEAERRRLASSRSDGERAAELRSRLSDMEGSVLDHVESALFKVEDATGSDWETIAETLRDVREKIHGIVSALPEPSEEVEEEAQAVETRLSELQRVFRKHDADEETLLALLSRMRGQLETGRSLDSELRDAESQLESVRDELAAAAAELSARRREAAQHLEASLGPELEALAMPGAGIRFVFEREESPDGVGPIEGRYFLPLEGGIDRISLRFQSHQALDWGELGRVASGGELSRVLLAMQAVLGQGAPPGSWVFDEIDQGVGGETARRVGDRLARMSEHTQVLLVTHLPAIAALADRHFTVEKDVDADAPLTHLQAVSGEARLGELARMLSGDMDSKVARRHARELLRSGPQSGVSPS